MNKIKTKIKNQLRFHHKIKTNQDQPAYVASPVPIGYTPSQIRTGYGVDKIGSLGQGQIIAIIIFIADPSVVQQSFITFSQQFGLPSTNLTTIDLRSDKTVTNDDSTLEACLDTQWSHAMAPNANIMFINTDLTTEAIFNGGVQYAINNGADVISMSFGAQEYDEIPIINTVFESEQAWRKVFVASSGDIGTVVQYPSSSPQVVAIGGTTLNLTSSGRFLSETTWSDSGGGPSAYFKSPCYQRNLNPSARTVPDISFDANPGYTSISPDIDTIIFGVTIVVTGSLTIANGWYQVGGTSVGAPAWSGIIAAINSRRYECGKNTYNSATFHEAIYALQDKFTDIVNGISVLDIADYPMTSSLIYSAVQGYDYVTGLGSPNKNILTALVRW